MTVFHAVVWVMTGRPVEAGPVINPAPHPPFPCPFSYSEGRKAVGAGYSTYESLTSQQNEMPASIPVTRFTT